MRFQLTFKINNNKFDAQTIRTTEYQLVEQNSKIINALFFGRYLFKTSN